jgi:hypothetical protein
MWRFFRIDENEKTDKAKQDREAEANRNRALESIQHEKKEERLRHEEERSSLQREHEERLKRAIGVLIDDLHEKYFRNVEKLEEKHKHRSTLFQCVQHGSDEETVKRLVIYYRCGKYLDSDCSWPVDDNEPDECHGIAGQAWFHGMIPVKTAECEWPSDPNNLIDQRKYADSIEITVDEAARLNVKSKVFAGARIEVRGNRWGVIVLDSTEAGHILNETHKRTLLKNAALLISSIIDRMGS